MIRRSVSFLAPLALVGGLLVAAPAEVRAAVVDPSTYRWCTAEGYGAPRAVPRRFEKAAARALRSHDTDYVVRKARPTQLGVIALVTGDVAQARRELRGVRHVLDFDARSLNWLPGSMRIYQVVINLLNPVLHESLRAVRGVPGRVGPAYWVRGGAVVLEWKAPLPAQVAALDGVRRGGVEVRVVPRRYSAQDTRLAMDRLEAYLDEHDVSWSTMSSCQSYAGLELGVPYDVGKLEVTQAELDGAAGMRVLVGEVHVGF